MRTLRRGPASQGGRQVFPKKMAQAVANSVYFSGLDRFLAVAIHAFVSAVKAILKFLVGEVTGGHGIAASVQNIPSSLRGQVESVIAGSRAPEILGQTTTGGKQVQDALDPVRWTN